MVVAAVFDAYGTLLDVHSAMQRHAARLGPDWARISQEWRDKHLEYSWVRSLAAQHRDFWALARESLDYVAAQHNISDRALLDDVRHASTALWMPTRKCQPCWRACNKWGSAGRSFPTELLGC
ncbi:MAG: HAD-IA family hydrolase [Acetobacteraceae bacterium]|nr:HAD-IA family hydrolase [Acetobacteraceae bacterium]MBV8526391.1 HAD-IA family hydrolase [Acetobacteraceae bacterium]